MTPSALALRAAQAATIRAQAASIMRLTDRVAELETALGARVAPASALSWLTAAQRIIFGILLTGRLATHATIEAALWGGNAEHDRPGNPRKVIHVQVHNLRKALRARGVVIVTVYETGRYLGACGGYRIPADMLAKAKALAEVKS